MGLNLDYYEDNMFILQFYVWIKIETSSQHFHFSLGFRNLKDGRVDHGEGKRSGSLIVLIITRGPESDLFDLPVTCSCVLIRYTLM